MVSFRTFIRSVKDINDDKTLFEAVKAHDPSNTVKSSGVRSLESLVCKNIPALHDKTVIEMYKILNVLVPVVSTDNTTQNVYVHIRKCVKARCGEESDMTKKAYTVMQFDREKWRSARAAYQEKVVQRNNNKKQFDEDTVYSVMDRIKSMTAPDHIDLAIGLQLASGGRISEILSYADFEPVEQPYIKQTGILKSKERETITKPIVHYSVDDFMNMFKSLRQKLVADLRAIRQGKITHYELSQKYNSKINRRISKYFGESMASHSLRKIYGSLAYRDYADRDKTSESAYLSDILGHAKDSLDVSKSYSTVSVVKNEENNENQEPFEEQAEDIIVPRNLNVRDGKAGERLAETVRILNLKGLPVNNAVLRSYGYGAKVVGLFLRTYVH